MARIRTIKPEFWTDEKILNSSPSARLLFLGLLNFADDEGNIEGGCVSIKAKIFPCDNIKVGPLLSELCENRLITPYGIEDDDYYHINNFHKHQRIDKKSKPRCPVYEGSQSTPIVLNNHSTPEVVSSKGSSKGSSKKHIEHPKADAPPASENFDLIWSLYPEKKGRGKAYVHFKAQVKTEEDFLGINKALVNYIQDVRNQRSNGFPELRWMHGSTWFNNNWRDYVNYKPPPKKTVDGIARQEELSEQALFENIIRQVRFVKLEIESGEAPTPPSSPHAVNWFYMALGKFVLEYQARFECSPLNEDGTKWFDETAEIYNLSG